MPAMERFSRRFRTRGLEILAVSIDGSRAEAARFATEHGLTYPVLLDPDVRVASAYRVTAIPTHDLVDRTGVIRAREVGPRDWTRPETWQALEDLLR